MGGQKCRGCSSRNWEIHTDRDVYDFADGDLMYANCADCGRKVHPPREGLDG